MLIRAYYSLSGLVTTDMPRTRSPSHAITPVHDAAIIVVPRRHKRHLRTNAAGIRYYSMDRYIMLFAWP